MRSKKRAFSEIGKLVFRKALEVEPSSEEIVEELFLLGRLRTEPLSDQDIDVLRYAYRLRRLDVHPATLLREQWEAEKRFDMFLKNNPDLASVPEFVRTSDRDAEIHGFFDPLNSPSVRAFFHTFRSGVDASPRDYTKRGRDFLNDFFEALRRTFPTGAIRQPDEDKKADAVEQRRLNAVGQELVEKYGGDRSQAADKFLGREGGAVSEVGQRACLAVRGWQQMKKSQGIRKNRRKSGERSVPSALAKAEKAEAAVRAAMRRGAPWLQAKTHF